MTLAAFAAEFTEMVQSLEQGHGKIWKFFMGYWDLHQIFAEYGSGNICLVCCERDYRRCHRKIVAEVIAKELELEVVHFIGGDYVSLKTAEEILRAGGHFYDGFDEKVAQHIKMLERRIKRANGDQSKVPQWEERLARLKRAQAESDRRKERRR